MTKLWPTHMQFTNGNPKVINHSHQLKADLVEHIWQGFRGELVDALSLVHSAVQTGCVVLRESDNRLDVDKHVEGEAQNGVRRRKVLVSGPRFVHLDDDEPRSEGARAQRVEESVGEGARALLRGSVCGLQDQGCLDGEQEAGGVEEGMRGEEDELLGEDGAPYDGSEDPDATLRNGGGAYPQVVVQRLALDLACVASLPQQRLLLALPASSGYIRRDPCCRCHYVARFGPLAGLSGWIYEG